MPINENLVKELLATTKAHKIELMAVTKRRALEDVVKLQRCGVTIFGENQVQEAEKKYKNLINREFIKLHLIGPLQSNKTIKALKIFDVIQTLDRKKIIDAIYEHRNQDTVTKEFYLQINIGQEPQKSGIDPKDTPFLFEYAQSKNITIVGLMCIPPLNASPDKYFSTMLKIRDSIDPALKLSMGMSGDYKTAIKNGSNLIRVGSLLFND